MVIMSRKISSVCIPWLSFCMPSFSLNWPHTFGRSHARTHQKHIEHRRAERSDSTPNTIEWMGMYPVKLSWLCVRAREREQERERHSHIYSIWRKITWTRQHLSVWQTWKLFNVCLPYVKKPCERQQNTKKTKTNEWKCPLKTMRGRKPSQ